MDASADILAVAKGGDDGRISSGRDAFSCGDNWGPWRVNTLSFCWFLNFVLVVFYAARFD